MITLQCKLEFQSSEDKRKVLELTRRWSSCLRYAYNRLIEGYNPAYLRKHLQKLFNLSSKYVNDAIMRAQYKINSMKALGNNPRKLIFGGKKLFFQLKKNHLQGNKRKKLYEEWKERRQGTAYSRGQKHARGNLNFRFFWIENQLYMRINVGKRNWIYAKVKRKVKRQKDKWINFANDLLTAMETKRYFPYSIELKLKNGEVYAFITIEEKIPETCITKATGIIGIDINASPFHLALTEISQDGNLLTYHRINLNEFIGSSKEKRNYLAWQVAHKIIDFALQKNKAIAIENLKKLPKGKRGDGMAKLRRKFQQWSYKSILEKIEILALRNGIEIIKVYPSFTSIIGKLKYAPQYNIDKDIAGAFVIGRRALGFTEKLPKNYKILSQDLEFLMFSLARIEDKIEEVKEKIKKEGNEYKANALKMKLKELKNNYSVLLKKINFLQSGKSEPISQQPVNRGKERVRGNPSGLLNNWRVLSIALAFSHLEKTQRDFSPLKRILISGDWKGVATRVSPVTWERDD